MEKIPYMRRVLRKEIDEMNKKYATLLIACIIFGMTVFYYSSNGVKAEEPLSLGDYQKELDRINQELGINYSFPSEELLKAEGRTPNDVEKFFQQMSIEEFRDYIYTLVHIEEDWYNGVDLNKPEYSDTNSEIDHCYPLNIDNSQDNDDGEVRSYTYTQKFYYSGEFGNYFYIRSTVFYANGHDMYASIDKYGDHASHFPCLYVTGFDSTISTDRRTVSCDFTGDLHLSEYIVSTSLAFPGIVFTANGGDIGPMV